MAHRTPSYAPPFARLAAGVLDVALYYVACEALALALPNDTLAYHVLVNAMLAVYYVAMESSPLQASFGKIMLGIYVATQDDEKLSPMACLVRLLIFSLPQAPLIALTFTDGYAALLRASRMKDAGQRAAELATHPQAQAISGQIGVLFALGMALLALLYLLPILLTPERKGLHDFLMRTRVFAKEQQRSSRRRRRSVGGSSNVG